MDDYTRRTTDQLITESLTFAGAVAIDGARAVGKTESARRFSKSELRLDSSDPLAILSREQPTVALAGDTPRLLDEWQMVPELWNEVRHAVDARRSVGQFILSGSAAPDLTPLRHSGAGRFAHVRMRTMTFTETEHSTGQVSLRALLQGETIAPVQSEVDFEGVVRRIITGGWPGWQTLDEGEAQQRALAYVTDLVEHDFPTLAGSGRDPRRFRALLRGLAALVAQPASLAAMQRRVNETEHISAGDQLIRTLVDIAQRMYVLEDQAAWSPKLRSRTTAMQTPNDIWQIRRLRRHFWAPAPRGCCESAKHSATSSNHR
ncbi:ATP-binding protein [Leucobacter insecticola]|uniref:ATP-binding protein n=1 Tax=Leucobacter insecticola TaxID=2714934 RepID=UPI00197F1C90|nr:AAA family ATPase [Leucobacter insecticola]